MLSCSGLVSEERGSRYCSVTQETEVTRSGPGDKLLEASEDGGQTVTLRGGRRDRRKASGGRKQRLGGARSGGSCVEEGVAGETDRDRLGRGSSFRKSVSGLVRRVSQRVTRENKEPLRRRGSRRTRSVSTKRSFKRTRSIKRPVVECDKDRNTAGPIFTKQTSVQGNSLLHRINLFVTSSFSNFLLLIGYHHPKLAREMLTPELSQGVVEKEEIEILPKRYRPDNLTALCAATGFNQSEMKRLYRIFKSECPSGLITEEVFHNIFSKFFPLGAESYNANVSSYSHYVFSALVQDDSEVITFEDFVVGLSILVNGTQEEKLEWTFHLYDLDGDGVITREEMEDVAMSIFELMGDNRDSDKEAPKNLNSDAESDILKKIDLAFQKFDLDGDGVVDLQEFLTVCRDDPEIQRSLLCINNINI